MVKRAGFCVVNSNYIDQALVCLGTFKETQTDYIFDFYIYYKEGTNVSRLKSLGYSLVPFSRPRIPAIQQRYDEISDMLLEKMYIFEELSNKYNSVFNVDLDMHFRKSLKEVFEYYTEPYWYGCLEEPKEIVTYTRKELCSAMGISPDRYINVGFTILNTPIKFSGTDYIKFFYDFPNADCPEQDYINYTYKDIIRVLPNDIAWHHLLNLIFDPYIAHHLGKFKPFSQIPKYFMNDKKFMKFKIEYINKALSFDISHDFKQKLEDTLNVYNNTSL